ncbi:MAG: HPF/RaiA family ribosome-associated protein [Candidatus Eremiobacteraeota bacterium]|nr:HPF/RaiA family ribosome-associated protein [Candidatus Eremiobacteraeota bacterium]MBV9645991.1 HPF/RaiA family ribosome-associated protein [Candidatus Eremiobacteraeota bacterium]
MVLPVQVTYRKVRRTEALDRVIHEEAAKLERFFERIVSCRVLIELAHRHRRSGVPFHVRIDLGVPGDELVISNEPTLHSTLLGREAEAAEKSFELDVDHKTADRAVRDAFRKAQRRLGDYARRKAKL